MRNHTITIHQIWRLAIFMLRRDFTSVSGATLKAPGLISKIRYFRNILALPSVNLFKKRLSLSLLSIAFQNLA